MIILDYPHSSSTYTKPLSAVDFVNRAVVTATDQQLTCRISGLSADTTITWVDNDNLPILDTDTDNYVIDPGTYVLGGSKASVLTIKKAKLDTWAAGDTYNYKCKLKSALYPVDSPTVVNQMVLTILELGETYFFSSFNKGRITNY